MDLDLAFQVLVAQFFADEEGGEGRGVERRAQARPQPGQSADMVLVRMGQDDADNVIGILLDKGRIGHDQIHARRGLIAEGHADIDDDPLAVIGRAIAVAIEIHADLVRAAQRQEDEFVFF